MRHVDFFSTEPRNCVSLAVRRILCRRGVRAIAVASLIGAPMAQAQDAATLEEIVVTAQKRVQTLEEVPASISVFSEDTLTQMNVVDFSGFADSVPGVTYATTGLGNSQYFIRGVGQVGGNQAPTTGVYLDEIPLQSRSLGSSSQPDPQLFDVARVEVLRGPQGVIFGSSAMGGIVRIVTNKPDATKLEAAADVGVATITDGAESWDAKGMVNIPLDDDKLALRLVGVKGKQGGWIDDLRPVTSNLSENLNRPDRIEKDANYTDYYMMRAALSWIPADGLTITPSVLFQDSQSNTDRAHSDVTFGLDARMKARYQPVWSSDKFLLGNLLVEKDLSTVSILSSSSYMDRDFEVMFDSTAFRSPQIEEIVGPSPNGQLYWSSIGGPSNTKQFVQEVRVVSKAAGPLKYIGGVYFKNLDVKQYFSRPSRNLFGVVAPLPFGASNPPVIEQEDTGFKEEEYAAFGEVSYDFTSKWGVAVGGRVFKYDQTDSRERYGLGGEAGGDLTYRLRETNDESGFTPRVILTYRATSELNLYGSYSTGFRTGGTNTPIPDDACSPQERAAAGLPDTPPPYKSDETENFEVGAKTNWADGRVRVNVAAYSIKWKDFQQNVEVTCGPNPAAWVANAGEVESKGGEFELVAQVTSALQLSSGIAYTDASYKEPFTTLGLPAGTALLDVPKLTWNARAMYDFPLFAGWRGNAMLSANYVDDTISGFGEGEVVERPSYTLVDFGLAASKDALTISLYANNLTDETPVYGQEFATSPDTTTATSYFAYLVGAPRTVGIRASVKF